MGGMMELRHRMLANQPWQNFKIVSYLQGVTNASKRTYIDLGRKFDSTHRYKFQVNFGTRGSKELMFFGARGQCSYRPINSSFTYLTDYMPIFYAHTNMNMNSLSTGTHESIQTTWDEWQEIEIKVVDSLFTIKNSSGTIVNAPSTASNGIWDTSAWQSTVDTVLFSYATPTSRAAVNWRGKMRLYEEYDENDKLITRLIPCRNRKTGKLGMVDTVTWQFYTTPVLDFVTGVE